MTPQQIQQLNDASQFIQMLKSSNSIPVEIDQSFRDRFNIGNYRILYAGTYFTTGGSATETITGLAGVSVGDIVLSTLNVVGGTPRTIITTTAGAASIVLVFSGDPSNTHQVNYIVIR